MSSLIGAEQDIIDRWVDGRLRGAAAQFDALGADYVGIGSRVFNMFAPTGTRFPFVIYQAQTPPRDVRGVGISRIMVDTLYVVKAVAQTSSFSDLAGVAAVIDSVMTDGDGEVVADGTILTSVREGQFSLVEVEEGKQFRHFGGEYRIFAQAA